MLRIYKLNLPLLLLILIALSPVQASAKTFSWTDKGTVVTTKNDREYRVKIYNIVKVNPVDICNVDLDIKVKMKGKKSRRTTSLTILADGKEGLEYGLTFSYKKPKGGIGKRLRIDGYNSLTINGKEHKLLKDTIFMNNTNLEFDFYEEAEGLSELNRYTKKLSAKCEVRKAKKKKDEDTYFKNQTVYYDDETSHESSKQALRYLTSKKYLKSVNYNNGSGRTSDFFMATGKNHTEEKLKNIYKIKDKDIGSCVAEQGQRFNEFFNTEKQSADQSKIIPWMYSFNIKTPVLHLLDTRHSGNKGVKIKAHLGKDAKWHIYFVLGKPSSRYDESKKSSYCYTVSSNHLVGLTNDFYKKSKFQTAKAKLDKKLKTSIEKENKQKAEKNQKIFIERFKKEPAKMLTAIEKNIASKINAKAINSKNFNEKITATQHDLLKLLELVKSTHPKVYKNNFKRIQNKNWYKKYIK